MVARSHLVSEMLRQVQFEAALERQGITLPVPPAVADPRTVDHPRCSRCRGATYAVDNLTHWCWHCRMCGWESADYLWPQPDATAGRRHPHHTRKDQ